ncbi:hypothetical protein P280DRAFT_471531 [Massarina eburnea CBS 473.64]|uniref:RING-type domain-containing protein n=1 Tax=Massarina eburnea CBS 473.64 TaxID=1395130 RepID=A0A6A6RTW1_9PLEO|nr:hypothetical protein P280DRAFT_471531 [Massarina eburnea CBS 473.64]
MSAQSINIVTIDFPDPRIDVDNDHFSTLPLNESFQYPIRSNIQTLTSKKVERGNDPYGLLFVPDLSSDACREEESAHISSNVTRLVDLPSAATEYALIAFAPWFNASCMTQYFEAARRSHLKAFVVYQPGDSNDMPPVMNDASWLLNDGGSWMTANQFPTYALSSSAGSVVAQQLSVYSGNITSLQGGDSILRSDPSFRATDYVRLWATVNTDPGSQLPSLWIFLLIVLALLILAFSTTSVAMHLVQRRRRNALRQRVVNGEVDLEALGVSRLSVPRDFLEKLPLYTYPAAPATVAEGQNLPSPTVENGPQLTRTNSAPTVVPVPHSSGTFSQTTCSICLDDFEPNVSQVRELPCQHIYHADCIDTFLISNSSLCPLCKKSVLPIGYCPKTITNIMVRRERLIRRTRGREQATHTVTEQEAPTRPPGAFGSLGSRVRGAGAAGRRIFSAPERSQSRAPDIEMNAGVSPNPRPPIATPQHPPTSEITPAPEQSAENCQPPSNPNRREWARQRAMTLVGNRNVPNASEEEHAGPRWKRGLRKVFPGFR